MQCKPDIYSQLHVIAGLLLFVLVAAPAYGQLGLGLSPMRVDISLERSLTYSGSLEMTNEAGGTTHIKGEVLDFYIDDLENPQFGNYPESTDSCSSFLRISPRDVDLNSKQHQLIRYTFTAPSTLKPGTYHCAAGFTTQPVPDANQSGLSINVQVVAAFYINVGSPTYRSEIRRLSLEADPADPKNALRAYCVLTNIGEYAWRPVGGLDILAVNGSVSQHVALRSLPVFPKNSQRFLLPLKGNPKEGEVLRLSINIGNGEIEEARVPVSPQMLAH